ncbi:DUF11 domain-containing protein [Candidatus Woesearchaeota archaeon]|nr:DUF11 domain-containing protein [Candidatus Woesearchaeota archaeon]
MSRHASHTKRSQDYALVFLITLVVAIGIAFVANQGNITGAVVILPTSNMSCLFVELANNSCPGGYTKILGMSNHTNAHAELPNQTVYNVSVCCRDLSGGTILNNSGTTILNLSNFTNSHAGLPGQTTYATPVFLGATSGAINCFTNLTGAGNCGYGFTCITTLSNTTNAHVANCSAAQAYNITVCCSIGGLVTRYFHPTQPIASNLTANGSINGALQSNNETYPTQTITYINLTNNRRHVRFTGNFNTNDVDARALFVEYNDTHTVVNTTGVASISSTHTLFVRKDLHRNLGVRACPVAVNLSQVNETCTNGINFTGSFPQTAGGLTVSIEGNEYRVDGLNSSGVMILSIVNSTTTGSNISNSSIFNSTKLDSTINNSDINHSTNFNCTFINSTEVQSFCDRSTVVRSNIINSTIINDTITDSNLLQSIKINSTIINSSIVRSGNVNCTIMNSSEVDSSCLNSNITNSTILNLTIINATVTNNFCTNGQIQKDGRIFNCPLALFELSPLNLTFSKTDRPDPVARGDLLNYTIFVQNNDNTTAVSLNVTETYPAQTTFVTSSPPATSGNNFFAMGNLTVGSSFTINITLRVNFTTANNTLITNTFNITYLRPSNISFEQTNTTTTTVIGLPNITTNKTDDPDPVVKGKTLNYTIFIRNTGDEVAYNITIVENYPTGTLFNISSPAPTSGNGTYFITSLAPNETATINISLNLTTLFGNGTIINNTYNITWNGTLGHQFNTSNSTSTTVLGYPIVDIVKQDIPDPVISGQQLNYRITITNNGDNDAINVTLVEFYPANVTLVSTQPLPIVDNNTFLIGNLSPGQTFVVNITLTVSPTMVTGVLNNTINVTHINTTGEIRNVTITELTRVIPPSGGQGGGSNSFVPAVIYRSRSYTMTSQSILTPYLRRQDKIVFVLEDGLHTLTVLDMRQDEATLRILSNPQQVTIPLYKSREIDATGDGKPDISITINDIANAQFTQLKLSKIGGQKLTTEYVPAQHTEPPTEPAYTQPSYTEPAPSRTQIPRALAGQAYLPTQAKQQPNLNFLVPTTLVFIALVIVAYLVWEKKHPPQGKTHIWQFKR